MSSNETKAEALAAVQALIAGTQKHLATGTFTVGNVAYTAASMDALLQSVVDAMIAVNTAQIAAKHALATAQGIETQVDPTIQAYVRFILGMYDSALPTLADFGLSPRKVPAPRTAEQKAAAAAKARATREARGTAGKKQKAAVKGNVTGILVTPITAPTAAASAAPVAPVTSASPSAQPVVTASNAPAPNPGSVVTK